MQVELPVSRVLSRGIVDAGLLLRRESITADRVPGGERSVHSAEPYAQMSFPVGPAVVTTGARVALHEQWGNFVAPRIAALWRPRESLAIRVGAGVGFRTPDFKELYLDFANTAAGYAVVGNPDLQPERSTNFSGTITRSGTRGELRLVGHTTAFERFIETQLTDTSSATYTYQNLERGRIAGTEIEWLTRLGPARVEMSHAYLWSRVAGTGRSLLGRTPHTLSLGVTVPRSDVEFSLRALWNSRTPIGVDDSTGATVERAAFAQLDLAAMQRLDGRFSVRLGAANVLNARPRGTWPTFAGRQLFLGIEFD